jgi:hypothetical protein
MDTCRRGLCNKSEETEKGDWIGLDDVIYHDEVPHVICMYVICVILFGITFYFVAPLSIEINNTFTRATFV